MKYGIKNHFYEALKYIKESKNYIYFAVILFFVSSMIGFIFAGSLGFLDKILIELAEKTRGLGMVDLIFFIMQNNVQATLIAIVFGVFFSIVPVFNAIVNGIVLGYVTNLVFQNFGPLAMWKILPHGVFELPAIFISIGLGIRLGFFIFYRKRGVFMERLYQSLNVFLFVIFPLLVIAAVIEGVLIVLIK